MSTQAEVNRQICDLLASIIFAMKINPDGFLMKNINDDLATLDEMIDVLGEENETN